MTSWTVDQLLEATQGRLVTGDRATAVRGVCLDSRQLQPGEAFLAIRGQRLDAHAFLPEAIVRGASGLIISALPVRLPSVPTIHVSDTTSALGSLAAFHRRRFNIPVVAVTGSCGKTTTKELIAHLLSQQGARVLKTTGTQNNHIGLPLTLLRLDPAHEFAVVELGSNHPGEIATLARIARPTVAVITNVGPVHLEFFGSLDVVRQEKLSLLEALEPGGAAIVPGDQLDVLLEAKSRLPSQRSLLTFGSSEQCGVQALEIRRTDEGLTLRVRGVSGAFAIPLLGYHNVENVLAALACAKALGLPLESLQDGLRGFTPLPMRSEILHCNGFTILNDCYNANPLSFARALEMLRDLRVKRRVVIAGDMLELGDCSHAAHQAIGHLAAQFGMNVVVGVGTFADDIVQGASGNAATRTFRYGTIQELLQQLPSIIQDGDGLLVKGSRKLQLDQVTTFLRERAHHASPAQGDCR